MSRAGHQYVKVLTLPLRVKTFTANEHSAHVTLRANLDNELGVVIIHQKVKVQRNSGTCLRLQRTKGFFNFFFFTSVLSIQNLY